LKNGNANASEPVALAEFEDRHCCTIVVTSPVARDGVVTYVKHRVEFYVDGNKEKNCYLF